jgi:hypothetical protein
MDPGSNGGARSLPIDGELLSGVLARLRRDTPAAALRWTLGDRGTAEIDACFTASGPIWTSTARLWTDEGRSVTTATVHCVGVGADEVRLVLEPDSIGPEVREDRISALQGLAQAAVDELAEELLWHATRAGLTQRG